MESKVYECPKCHNHSYQSDQFQATGGNFAKLSTRTLYQPDFKQKRQIIPDTGSRPAGIICRSLYAH